MKLLPKRQLGVFLMVVSAVFFVAAGVSFFSFTVKSLQQGAFPEVEFEFPHRWLALPLALIGTGFFLAGIWLVLYPKEQTL